MIKYRLEITKGEALRYISHLDYASLVQRAVCRAQLPAAYSEGFNPHMKISFASALSVGITSRAEYMDLELNKDICQPELFDRLRQALPPGAQLLRAKRIEKKGRALTAIVDEAAYEIEIEMPEADEKKISAAFSKLNEAKEVIIVRQTPKKSREIEIKQYMPKGAEFALENNTLKIFLRAKITPSGTIKPTEALIALKERFGLNIPIEEASVCRTGLYAGGRKLIDAED